MSAAADASISCHCVEHTKTRAHTCELPFHTHVCELAWHTDTQNPKKNLESGSSIWIIVAGKFGDASAPFGVCSLAGQIRRVGEKTKPVTVSKGNVELKTEFVIGRCVFVIVDMFEFVDALVG